MASSDAKPIPQKNVAYRITFPILDADGDLVAGAADLDSEISKDGGDFTDCTNEATQIATSSGVYFLDLTSTEMNADCVAVIVKTSSSGAKTTTIILYPEEAGDIRVNVTQVNGNNQTAGDIISRLPSSLVSGRIDASVGAMATDVLTASALAANAVSEIQTGLVTTSMDVDGKTFQEFCRLVGAVLLGKASGMTTDTGIFRALNDSKVRVTATLDGQGNRLNITLDAT